MDEQAVFDALKYRVEVDICGTRRYHNGANQLHRENGPAVVWSNGTKFWLRNDQKHRTDGPAVEFSNGHVEWYQNNRLHRTNGPAVEYSDGDKAWYINGEELTEDEFNQRVKAL